MKSCVKKISIHFRTWITWISAKKKPKTRFSAAASPEAEEECSFKAILNSFLWPWGTFCQIWYWETVCKNASAGFCRSLVMNLLWHKMNWEHEKLFFVHCKSCLGICLAQTAKSKGQLISKCLFGVFKLTKKRTKFLYGFLL